jgi:dolichol-phosphate mannosyltransferase
VHQLHLGVLSATALALVTTFVLRFAATEALVYLPRRGPEKPGRGSTAQQGEPCEQTS